jgi:cytochrome P450
MDLLTLDADRPELDDIDLFDPERFQTASQHGAWRALRAAEPVWPSPSPDGVRVWSVTKYADVMNVLKDTRRYSSEYGTILDVRHGDPAGGKTINLMDPPRHTGVRRPTSRAMAATALRATAREINSNVERMVAPLREPGVHDFADGFLPLAMATMGPVLGIPEPDWTTIARAAMAGVAPSDPVYARGDQRQTLHSAHTELFGLLGQTIADRRRRPGKDLVSLLLSIKVDGEPLTADEVLLNCYSFVMGANTTTPHVASQLALVLAQRPDILARLKGRPGLLPHTIEEALRWASPTNHLMRRATEDVRLGGHTIRAGELISAWVASANRDEDVFERPFEFLPDRRPNPHIAFGTGVHICVGALGARVVLRLAMSKLLAGVSALEVAGPVRHVRSNFINGISELRVRVS